MTAQSEGLEGLRLGGRSGGGSPLLHFAFLHSCLMTQPSAASHPGCLLFPTRNCFQVTCRRRFPAALLSLAHLPVTLRAQICVELRWEDHPCLSDCRRMEMVGEWCCGRNFYLQTGLFHPCTNPLGPLSPRGDRRQRMADRQGLIPNPAAAPASCSRPACPGVLQRAGAAACRSLHQAWPAPRSAVPWADMVPDSGTAHQAPLAVQVTAPTQYFGA